jgi:ankyrin repeat protein
MRYLFLCGMLLATLVTSCSFEQDVHDAASRGNLERIQAYLQNGGRVDTLDIHGYSLLSTATSAGHVRLMQYLLDQGAEEKQWVHREALLHLAVESGKVEAVKFLLARGADVNSRTLSDSVIGNGGRTPLHLAAEALNYAMATYLLRQGAQINTLDEDGVSPLLDAIFAASHFRYNPTQALRLVQLLVEHGAQVNLASPRSFSPLAQAARGGHTALVNYLVQHGADINLRGENGQTAFCYAAIEANQPLCVYLTKLGARPTERLADGSSVFMQALQSNEVGFLRWLQATYHYNLLERDTSGQTVLMYTINTSGMITTSFVLNELNQDIQARDGYSATPLLHAARGVKLDKIKLLVEKGSHVNAQDRAGTTPIMWVAKQARVNESGPDNDEACIKAIHYLMQHGGRTDIRDKTGRSAVDYVKGKPFPELIALLEQ